MKIGIDQLHLYSSHYYVDLKTLATERGVDVDKFYRGIGQEQMAVPAPDEDVVTLARMQLIDWLLQASWMMSSCFYLQLVIDQSKRQVFLCIDCSVFRNDAGLLS